MLILFTWNKFFKVKNKNKDSDSDDHEYIWGNLKTKKVCHLGYWYFYMITQELPYFPGVSWEKWCRLQSYTHLPENKPKWGLLLSRDAQILRVEILLPEDDRIIFSNGDFVSSELFSTPSHCALNMYLRNCYYLALFFFKAHFRLFTKNELLAFDWVHKKANNKYRLCYYST